MDSIQVILLLEGEEGSRVRVEDGGGGVGGDLTVLPFSPLLLLESDSWKDSLCFHGGDFSNGILSALGILSAPEFESALSYSLSCLSLET